MIDNRIIRVGIELDGQINFYENLAISATGTKFANANQGECNVDIADLSQEVRQYILKETSPFNTNRTRKSITLEVGRESYGTSLLYQGDIYRSRQGQAPDTILSLRCLTGAFLKGNIIKRSLIGTTPLSGIAQNVASDNGLDLNFLVPEKMIKSYSYTGNSLGQVGLLGDLSGADAFVDGGTLTVKPKDMPLPGSVRLISRESGMIGVPELTEQGVRVTFLYDPATRLGSEIEIVSDQYREAEGRYVIYKLNYQITNRDVPFYYIAEARRL